MCGIAGLVDASAGLGTEALTAIAEGMAEPLRHRGPDDRGIWVDPAVGVAFGHRRLSIIDLSPEGHQPMVSSDGRWVLTYNGEIYNFLDLQKRLIGEGHAFRGRSDTEVLLEAVAAWGVDTALERANGMFALALWDRRDRCLWLARDRLGEKPLYYGRIGSAFAFASELKALRVVPDFASEIDRDALALLLRHNYVPAPWSIYRGIRKLRPGHLLRLEGDGGWEERPYWNAEERAEACALDPLAAEDATEALSSLLTEAVGMRMLADVPLGAFLSGGIDSSTIVALMQAQSSAPVRTFSIGFHEAGYDEAGYAKRVASHLGTDHTELYVTPEETRAVIPLLPQIYDEPFADSSQIPTFLVSQLARRHVTVALSGDGGDELFLGYDRYRWTRRINRVRRPVPPILRRALGGAIARRRPERLGALALPFARLAGRRPSSDRLGARIHRGGGLLQAPGLSGLYRELMSHWTDPNEVVIGGAEPITVLGDSDHWANLRTPIEQLAYVDSVSYLPDDILTKVDRASMAVSLEARVPFLDHRVVELAWRIPASMKLKRRGPKWVVREILGRHVPRELVERPKMGFGVPIDSWLRGPLREWAEDLLAETRLRDDGYFRPEPIRVAWHAHLSGRAPLQYHLWDVLMFQAWLDSTR